MKKTLIPLMVTMIVFSATWVRAATDAYVASSASGAGNGTSCADARSVGSLSSADWVADATIHLCGIITTSLAGTGLAAQGSGTNGHPVTVLFESGAVMQSPAFGKAIDISGRSYIVVNGGANGVIQNTANGTALANHQSPTYGVYANSCTPGCRVTQIAGRSFYVRGSGDAAMGVLQTDISPVFFLHAPGMRVDHNTFSDCGWCINGYGTSGVEIDHNTVSKMDHGVASGPDAAGQDGQSIHDNDFSEMSQWDEPKGGYHHDGIHVFSDSGPNTHLMIYGNTFHGSLGKSTTAWTFIEGCNGCSYGVSQARIFNNTYVGSGNDGKIMIWMEARGQGTGNAVYNNYSYEGFGGGLGLFCRNENDFTAKNNIVGSVSFQSCSFSGANVDANVYFDLNSDFGNNNLFGFNGAVPTSMSSWRAACGCDAASILSRTSQINASTTDGTLSSPSSAKGLAVNLSSLGIKALDLDKAGAVRPATGAWDVGAYEYCEGPNCTIADAGVDGGVFDGGLADGGLADGATPNADAADAGAGEVGGGACNCNVGTRSDPGAALGWLTGIALIAARRRRS